MAIISARPATEGIWARAGSDTWRWIQSPWFLLMDAGLSFVTTALASEGAALDVALLFATVFVGVILVVFCYQAARAPFRQRDEARLQLKKVDQDDEVPPFKLAHRSRVTVRQIADELTGEKGLTRLEILHRILKAFWRGEFEDSDEASSLVHPHPEGGWRVDGRVPLDENGDPTANPPLHPYNRRALLSIMPPNYRVGERPSNRILRTSTWREIEDSLPLAELIALEPHLYEETWLNIFEDCLLPQSELRGWLKKFRQGAFED